MGHDEWWTKESDFNELCKWSGVVPDIDVSADERSTKVKGNFISKDEDALVSSWQKNNAKVAFMNPPNSELRFFLRRALKEWKENNMTVLMFIPIGVIGRGHFEPYWKLMVDGTIKIERDWKPWLPRPQFLEKGEINEQGNRNDYMALVLRSRDWGKLNAQDATQK